MADTFFNLFILIRLFRWSIFIVQYIFGLLSGDFFPVMFWPIHSSIFLFLLDCSDEVFSLFNISLDYCPGDFFSRNVLADAFLVCLKLLEVILMKWFLKLTFYAILTGIKTETILVNTSCQIRQTVWWRTSPPSKIVEILKNIMYKHNYRPNFEDLNFRQKKKKKNR